MLNSRPWVGWRPEFDYQLAGGYRSVKRVTGMGSCSPGNGTTTKKRDVRALGAPGPYVRRAEPPTAAEARAAGVEL